ncbi:MAG: hypothetical protein P8Y45_23205 [Exilibacterium sp.]
MRYFFSLTLSKASLSGGIGQSATVGFLVLTSCTAQRLPAGLFGTAGIAVGVAKVTVSADKNLSVAIGTVV